MGWFDGCALDDGFVLAVRDGRDRSVLNVVFFVDGGDGGCEWCEERLLLEFEGD